jgi:A/G-specific adenine glycosylase
MNENRFRSLLEQEGLSPRTVQSFRKLVYDASRKGGRDDLPWRLTRDPYRIMVSEIMLQQTQVARVRTKYEEFLDAFPDVYTLARAPLQEVLTKWQGLGYNRRGIALKRAAEDVVERFGGMLPETTEELRTLPGIGPYTSGAIAAFAFNRPELFIETNIRSVYLHLFFHDMQGVADREILPLVEVTLDRDSPREWYHALMDYGVMIKQETANPGRRSAHYVRQSAFKGSNREVRSRILKAILAKGAASERDLIAGLECDEERVKKNLADLEREGFIARKGRQYLIREG